MSKLSPNMRAILKAEMEGKQTALDALVTKIKGKKATDKEISDAKALDEEITDIKKKLKPAKRS